MKEIERIPFATREKFETEVLRRGVPVVLTGALNSWRAREWTLEFFHDQFGEKYITVEEGALFDCTDVDASGAILDIRRLKIQMKDFISRIRQEGASEAKLYLAEWPIFSELPELLDHISLTKPGLFPAELAAPMTMYMGPANSFAPLHFDHAPNLVAQLYGQKRWKFFSPTQTPYLYQYPSNAQLSHFSAVNSIEKMQDFISFPDFKIAQGVDVVIGEGDLLYVPPKWWHHVLSLSPSISLNVFWKPLPLLLTQIASSPKNLILGRRNASDVKINFALLRYVLKNIKSSFGEKSNAY